MKTAFFSSLLPELSTRAARATVGILGFSNEPLRRHLLSLFAQGYGEAGCFLADPVFEATFGWKTADQKMSQLSGNLLHPDVVKAMDKPWGESAKEYRFPADTKPYRHQLEAWSALLGPGYQSVVVTSGTGSGKTECFMVPVLSSIAQSKAGGNGGVQAIFLYPLNALIQSQRERLRAWTGPFGRDIRFCLYNGNTPEEAKADKYRDAPNEVHDRSTLRDSPPEILVTNPTMLEYMLVRAQDAPILEKSQGKLRWIVLDEAHNYIGSQAAELALLLRRVLHAFGTSADKVHFVATSATIGAGDEAARQHLREFLSSLAGVSSDRVMVVYGERAIPVLEAPDDLPRAVLSLEELQRHDDDPDGLYKRLTAHPVARRLRSLFVPAQSGQNFQPLSAVRQELAFTQTDASQLDALSWLDILTKAVEGEGRTARPFLPLRLHMFHNTLNGMWACANAQCPAKRNTELDDPAWAFGAIYTDERMHCVCGAPVYPLISCNDCNQTYLSADLVSTGLNQRLVAPTEEEPDEFSLDRDPEEGSDESELASDAEMETDLLPSARTRVLIVNGHSSSSPALLRRDSLELVGESSEATIPVWVQDVSVEEGHGVVLRCPECEGHEATSRQFRKPRLGAPFYLGNVIPTLLEYCPDGEKPLDMPRRGRRMITFTDSRQGTARIAAKLQQDAERNALRAAVYRKLVSDAAMAGEEQKNLRSEVDQFRKLLPEEGSLLRSLILNQIQEKDLKLAQLSSGKAVNYDGMVQWLSSQSADISRWIHVAYAESDETFRGDKGSEILARILLCREFGRRPKRQNSLETLGLVSVQYPKLNQVVTRRIAVEQAGFALDEWRSFLKIALDFFVRQHWAIQMPSSWPRWGAERVFPKQILPPSSTEKQTSKLIKWPKVSRLKRNNRLVRLLAYVLKLDPLSDAGRDRIDSLLLAAWDDLTASGLLQIGADQGRYLDLADTSYQTITKAWVCPVTRRVLDVTLRGVTPYLPEAAIHDGVTQCQPITVPICDVIAKDFANDDERVEAAREWVRMHPALQDARIEGVWSNLNDRVVEGAGFFRAVEHSAQQSGSRLEQYENMFKKGLINVMSCSTTMEMGVDIGGINMVAMNNVPPHPANYLQRAGRAGRRAETRAIALTVCKNNPHDQHVFRNTLWPFSTRLRTPGISLSSPLIVQRHINSMLLAYFLRMQSKEGKLNKLTLDWWMLPRGGSRQERFVTWCECFDEAKHQNLCSGVRALTTRTVFEGRSVPVLVAEAGRTVARHSNEWLEELNAIRTQISALSARDAEDKIPMRALEVQLKRMEGEYLLRELATTGVLPGYGFPTDITTFETLNKDSREIQRQREPKVGREDNKFQRRELPSRDTVTALREYAPGASVVIDGLVYQSAGITLNWHAPATLEQVQELQNIRRAWRCRHCGASGTFVLAKKLEHCPECGNELANGTQDNLQYLEPAGFSVDISEQTHNDITLQEYVPVEPPWISASGGWMPLPNPGLGRFRSTPQGTVFHHSSGKNKSGYALCLECGRAEPMGNADELSHGVPQVFQKPHARLRGGKTGGGWMCGGSDNAFKIKTGLRFGREYITDVLEVVLHHGDGQPLENLTVALTLAVALRRAIAESLGVEETELGCDTKMLRDDVDRKARAIQVFDTRSAGYSSLVAPELPRLLRMAKTKLQCEAGCEGACQTCLLTFDTRYRAEHLNRQAALEFLSDDWLDSLALDARHQLLGPASKAEFQAIDEAILRELNRGDARRLYVYLNGPADEWDLPASPLKRFMHRLSVKEDIGVCLVVSSGDFGHVSLESAAVLRGLGELGAVRLLAGKAPAVSGDGCCIATVERSDGSYSTWATSERSCAGCGIEWGSLADGILVSAPTGGPALAGNEVALPSVDARGVQSFAITNELDGKGAGFGSRFWLHISGGDLATVFPSDSSPVEVEYEDRYLATPIACALLLDVISAIKAHYQAVGDWGDVQVRVKTMWIDEERVFRGRRGSWSTDWDTTEKRDGVLEAAFDYSGMRASVMSVSKRELSHGRRLTLRFHNGGALVIWLDQGWSYWAMAGHHRQTMLSAFNMMRSVPEMGEALAEFRVDVQGHELSTQVFLESGEARSLKA